jgi:hypothetical protein
MSRPTSMNHDIAAVPTIAHVHKPGVLQYDHPSPAHRISEPELLVRRVDTGTPRLVCLCTLYAGVASTLSMRYQEWPETFVQQYLCHKTRNGACQYTHQRF